MSIIKEFHYSNVFQRKILYINIVLTFLMVSCIFSTSITSLSYYFIYLPVYKIASIMTLAGILVGNLAGKGLFSNIKKYRVLYVCGEVFFLLLVIPFLIRHSVLPSFPEPLIYFTRLWKYSVPVYMLLLAFFTGFKVSYFLKISCADFIDYKQAIKKFIPLVFLGGGLGLLVLAVEIATGYTSLVLLLLVIGIAISAFIINLPFEPQLKYAQDFAETADAGGQVTDKAPLVFTYLNFTYVILYISLGSITMTRFYGDWFYVKLFYLCGSAVIMLFGYIVGNLCNFRNCYIYSELLFPVLFLPALFILFLYNQNIAFYQAAALFAPSLFFFGITLNRSINNIIINYKNKDRYVIIDYSMFVLPMPILIAVSFISFTNLWFFVMVYLLVFVNILFPGIYMLNRSSRGIGKIMYFVFSLIIIPLLIFLNIYFSIPFNNKLYNSKVNNFDDLKNINYNAVFLKHKASVTLKKFPVFESNDTIVRNYKRSIVPLFLYHQDKKILFIDSTQKFFRNPFIGFFKNNTQLDPVPERMVDYNILPLSGKQTYVPVVKDLLFFLSGKQKYYIINDILNIFDQNLNVYKFSGEYYSLVKQHLQKDGIFVQTFDLLRCRSELLGTGLKNLKTAFKNHITFLFSNILVVLASDDLNAFKISGKNIASLKKAFSQYNDIQFVFSNETQVLSHMLNNSIDKLTEYYPAKNLERFYFLYSFSKNSFKDKMIDEYAKTNNSVLQLIAKTGQDYYLHQSVKNNIFYNNKILTLLKMTELTEVKQEYVNETKYLFELKKYFDYKVDLRKYLSTILSIKKEYYYNAALKLEKEKKWQKAKKLYKAILEIDQNSFKANYRMGILCITLQQIDESFAYLKKAMQLEKNHPKVLFHMGVLYFSRGKLTEAIKYFNQSLAHKGKSASVYYYLGMSYEKMKNLQQAEQYYNKAYLLDPNDENIKDSLKNIGELKAKEKNKWKTHNMKNQNDEETGIDIPLPINKAAIKMRLNDENKK